jgi:signal transduction histidine kinase
LLIVNELLTFEKLALGMFTLELVPTSILSFVRDAMKEFFISTQAKKIDFVLRPSIMTDEDQVKIDPVKMASVFRYIYMYVYIYMYMYTYIYEYIYIYVYI